MELDPPRILRASRFRFGKLRATGVPAILVGVAGIILAAGVTRSLKTLAPLLPETLRELKNVLEARRDVRPLKP